MPRSRHLFLLQIRAFLLISVSRAIYRQLRQASHFVYMMCIAAFQNVYIAQGEMCIQPGRAYVDRYGDQEGKGRG